MSDAERIWQEKSDEELLDAAAELDQFTPQGREIIRTELKRRGLEDPVEQADEVGGGGPGGGESGDAGPGEAREPETAEGEGDVGGRPGVAGPECLRCEVALEYRGTRKFHEGTHWGALGEIGHLFEHNESFDVYVCPNCGHVDLFVTGIG